MLTSCFECAGTVSTLAAACPHCGAPAQRERPPIEITPVRALGGVAIVVVGTVTLMYAFQNFAFLVGIALPVLVALALRRRGVRFGRQGVRFGRRGVRSRR